MINNKSGRVLVNLVDVNTDKVCVLESDVLLSRVLKLIDVLAKTDVPESVCLVPMGTIGFKSEMRYSYYPSHKCKIMSMSLMADFERVCPGCVAGGRKSDALERCAYNLANGRCKDEYVRNTIGETLFPKLYANAKQKIK